MKLGDFLLTVSVAVAVVMALFVWALNLDKLCIRHDAGWRCVTFTDRPIR